MKQQLDSVIKTIYAVAALLIGFSVFYYSVIWIPAHQKRLEDYLSKCLELNAQAYGWKWATYCRQLNMADNCLLPSKYENSVKEWSKEATNKCYEVLEKIK